MKLKKNSGCPGSGTKNRTMVISILFTLLIILITSCEKKGNDPLTEDILKAAGINLVEPGNLADSVVVDPVLSVLFNNSVDPKAVSTEIILKNGMMPVQGTMTFSGTTAEFKAVSDLAPESDYTATVKTVSKSGERNEYSWSFKTGKHHSYNSLSVASVQPINNSSAVSVSTPILVNFNKDLTYSLKNSVSIILKNGDSPVNGVITFSGRTATFKPSADLAPNTIYTGKVTIGHMSDDNEMHDDESGNIFIWKFTTAQQGTADITAPTVNSVVPLNSATSVVTSSKATVTFSEPMNASTFSTSTFILKQGLTIIAGSVTCTGSEATFTPASALAANTVYTATITTNVKDVAGNALASNYTWSFTTAAQSDVTAPTVLSVTPLLNSTSVAVSSKATITFSEAMNASTINSSTFTLKQGSASIAGTVTYSGNSATFTPSASLSGSALITATVTTGAKDVSGNALAANYVWSFTTVAPSDITAPLVSSVSPANNSTGVIATSKATATFSEAMNASTINTASFTMKQGSTSIAGSVTYSGTTATFTPSTALTAGTVYTCSITTAAKDVAGNPIASSFTWSFTSATAVPAGKSFSADVVPVLNLCNTCHTHPWTTSSNASTFYTNLVNGGFVNPSSPTTSKIYSKLNSGHPGGSTVTPTQVNTILTWMSEGSKNN